MRYKTEIRPYLGGIDVAKRLNPITFAWKDGGRRDIGFGAEDVSKVEPLLTFKNDKGEIEGVQYAQISTVLINSIKEQQSQIEMQSQQINLLQQQLRAQQRQIRRLLGTQIRKPNRSR